MPPLFFLLFEEKVARSAAGAARSARLPLVSAPPYLASLSAPPGARPGEAELDSIPIMPAAEAAFAAGDRPERWEMFHRNATVWPAVFALVEDARETLAVEQYIFSEQGIGARLAGALTAAARRGVRVRLLVDGFSSKGLPKSRAGRELLRAGGEILIYNPLSAMLRHPVRGAHRLHRKSVLADGRTMMAGGSCFHDRMADWRDTMIRIEGFPAGPAHAAFETIWDQTRRRSPEPRGLSRRLAEDPPGGWDYLTSEPVRPTRQDIYAGLLKRLALARESVTLVTPYLIPDRRFRRAIREMLGRGVRVRIVLPRRSDHAPLDLVSHWFGRRLGSRGVEVFAYEPAMVHAKLAVVDEGWAMVSSFNLDLLSFQLNVENGVAGTDPGFVAALGEQVSRDIAASTRL